MYFPSNKMAAQKKKKQKSLPEYEWTCSASQNMHLLSQTHRQQEKIILSIR